MKLLIIGGGWYGCHLATALSAEHEVRLVEQRSQLFGGASGANPARMHLGFHYPRSRLTRALCQDHYSRFMGLYGQFTRWVPVNIYAIAAHQSQLDWGTYRQVLRGEVEFFDLEDPAEAGLQNVEGAMQVPERHLVIRKAREHFARALAGQIYYSHAAAAPEGFAPDWTIDCTFCSTDSAGIDRYEPCVTGILSGRTDRAVTIMDGPFPSIYPWDEELGLSSLTSARYTPLASCRNYAEAEGVIARTTHAEALERAQLMLTQMSYFWPECHRMYELVDVRLSIRAQPVSASDARFCEVTQTGEHRLRVRAGKIDAVLNAEARVRDHLK